MESLSRRRALGFGSAALLCGSGCLAEAHADTTSGTVDLVSINRAAASHDVSVRVRATDGRELYRETTSLRSGHVYSEADTLAGGQFTITASLADNPFYEAEATFDVRGCADPRIVVVVEPGPRLMLERRGDDC